MMTPSLLLVEGLFHETDNSVFVLEDNGTQVNITPKLQALEGRSVRFSIHHSPPTPPLPRDPGFGCCLWHGHCPCGHQKDPTGLFQRHGEGVLRSSPRGNWLVGDQELLITHYMLGHRGRLVIFADSLVNPDAGVSDLLSETEHLLETLERLRSAVKNA